MAVPINNNTSVPKTLNTRLTRSKVHDKPGSADESISDAGNVVTGDATNITPTGALTVPTQSGNTQNDNLRVHGELNFTEVTVHAPGSDHDKAPMVNNPPAASPVENNDKTQATPVITVERATTPEPLPTPLPATPRTPRGPTTPTGPFDDDDITQHQLNNVFGLLPAVVNPEANVDARLMDTREALAMTPAFIAEVAGRNVHVWIMEGRVHRIVTRDAMADAERRHAEYTLLNNAALAMPDPADSAELSAIVRVHTENCFLQPDTLWNPSREHAGLFEDIKLRFLGVVPVRPPLLVNDFDSSYNNLQWLMSQIQNPSEKRQGLLATENGLRRIMFRHIVFERLTEDNAYTTEELALPAEYRMDGWPVSSVAARNALNAIRDTHRTRPMQAYDMHGALIPPNQYMKMLRGALVVVRFNVAAYQFGQVPNHRNTFVADVTYIHVLVPPTALSMPVSPRKKNVHARDPFGELLRSPRKMPRRG